MRALPSRAAAVTRRAAANRFLLACLLWLGSASATHASQEVRVATLIYSVEAALADIDGVTVVAGVRPSFRAPERTDVLDLGNPHAPSLERLAQAKPHVLVADAMMLGHRKHDLSRFDAEIVLIDTTSVDAMLEGLARLGTAVGAPAQLEQRVAATRRALAAEALREPVPVLALFGTPGSFRVITERTWLGSLLATLGFENVAAGLSGSERIPGYVDVSTEQLVTLEPELVLLVAHGRPEDVLRGLEAQLAAGGPLAALGRSARRGVQVLDPDLFLANPGLGLPRAAQALVASTTPPVAAQ